MDLIDRHWHLAQTEKELELTDFELQLWRVFFGFLRWQQECERNVNGTNLLGEDLSILHIIRMKDRPKTITDIARLLNRDDTFNIQYSVRKLIKMGLIKSIRISGTKSANYQITEAGIQNTERYLEARKKILLEKFVNDKANHFHLESVSKTLSKMKSIYDIAEHEAASNILYKNKDDISE